MKRLAILIFGLIFINLGLLSAQTNKGNILVGLSTNLNLTGSGTDLMSFGYSVEKLKRDGFDDSDQIKRVKFSFLPKLGYFAVDNLLVGLELNTAFSFDKLGAEWGNEKISEMLISAGPFVRYYIPLSKFYPIIEVNSLFGIINSKYDFSNNSMDAEYKYSLTAFGGGIGLAVPLGEIVSLDVLTSYNTLIQKNREDDVYNSRRIYGTLGLRLGFTIMLGSK